MIMPRFPQPATEPDPPIGSSAWSRHFSVSWLSTDHPTITGKIAMILNITECVNLEDFDEVNGAFNNIHQTVQEILSLITVKDEEKQP